MIETTQEHKLAIPVPLDSVTGLVYTSFVCEGVVDELFLCKLWLVVVSSGHAHTSDPQHAVSVDQIPNI